MTRKYSVEIAIVLCALVFSFWLMFHTFSYTDGAMYVATKAWSDFGSHVPLIRSFSFGNNIPVEYPLFPGEPIRYHFLFYALVGFLEKIGIRIDYALNIPSALLFAGQVAMIYLFAKTVFKSKAVGMLAVIFFLFNGSLSFLEFFKDHPLSAHSFQDIVTNTAFPSFAPYGKGIVSAFWNLNIYTNQRHLAGAYALSLLILFFTLLPIFRNRKAKLVTSALLGVVLGASFFFHMAGFFMTAVITGMIFLLFPKLRLASFITLTTAAIVALPQYLIMQSGISSFAVRPGYLIPQPLTAYTVFQYWFFNLGFHLVLIPVGFLLASKTAKKMFLAVLPLFILGNLFQFSVEIAANHKFFNYFVIFGSMFSAYVLVLLWKRHVIGKAACVILFSLLTFSGIIDFFPVYNDGKMALIDYPKNQDVRWIMNNTPKDAVFLNASYFMNQASIAGRKIFLGWPYFAWSQGYDTLKRDILRKKLLSSSDIRFFCRATGEHSLSYVIVERIDSREDYAVNASFFAQHFTRVYENPTTGFTLYDTKKACL